MMSKREMMSLKRWLSAYGEVMSSRPVDIHPDFGDHSAQIPTEKKQKQWCKCDSRDTQHLLELY